MNILRGGLDFIQQLVWWRRGGVSSCWAELAIEQGLRMEHVTRETASGTHSCSHQLVANLLLFNPANIHSSRVWGPWTDSKCSVVSPFIWMEHHWFRTISALFRKEFWSDKVVMFEGLQKLWLDGVPGKGDPLWELASGDMRTSGNLNFRNQSGRLSSGWNVSSHNVQRPDL